MMKSVAGEIKVRRGGGVAQQREKGDKMQKRSNILTVLGKML